MAWELWLVASGDGRRVHLGYVTELSDAYGVVDALDARYAKWDAAGRPELFEDDPLNSYEGGDIEARNLAGEVRQLDADGDWV